METLTELAQFLSGLSPREIKLLRDTFKFYEGKRLSPALEELLKLLKNHGTELSPQGLDEALRPRLVRLAGNMTYAAFVKELCRKTIRFFQHNRDAQKNTLSIQEQATRLLEDAGLLMKRGLFDGAIRYFEEAGDLAAKWEYYDLEQLALKELIYLNTHRNHRNYQDAMGGYLKRLKCSIDRLNEESDFYTLHYESFILIRLGKGVRNNDIKKKVDAIKQNPLLLDTYIPETFLGKIFQLNIRSTLAQLEDEKMLVMQYYEQILQIWDANEHQKEERKRRYAVALYNYLGFCVLNKNVNAYDQYFKTYQSLKFSLFDEKAEAAQNLIFLQQLHSLNSGNFQKTIDLIPEIESCLQEYQSKIPFGRKIAFQYNTLVAYFALKNYDKALDVATHLQNFGRTEQRADLQAMAKIFQIIFYLELNNHQMLSPVVRNLKQNLRDHEQYFDFERMVLSNLAKLANLQLPEGYTGNKAETQAVYQDFQTQMEAWIAEGKNIQIYDGFNEILAWLKSKSTGRPFSEFI